ncbi:MAG: acyl carrier protein [Elusimicrobia bacterium]|nr:acyl carrier protein [Elusimicrobiota bacterium]
MDLTEELLAFFREGADGGLTVDAATPLLEWGLLDSVRILDLADLLAAKAGYKLDASALKKENFKDVRSIVRLVGAGPAKRPARRKAA